MYHANIANFVLGLGLFLVLYKSCTDSASEIGGDVDEERKQEKRKAQKGCDRIKNKDPYC